MPVEATGLMTPLMLSNVDSGLTAQSQTTPTPQTRQSKELRFRVPPDTAPAIPTASSGRTGVSLERRWSVGRPDSAPPVSPSQRLARSAMSWLRPGGPAGAAGDTSSHGGESSRSVGSRAEPSSAKVQETTDNEVMQFLISIGYSQYVELFSRKRVAGEMLHSLSNVELRDDLGITSLRHRREILNAIANANQPMFNPPGLPEFGRILTHLSNMRSLHSWLRLGFQHVIFSLALLRLAPGVRSTNVAQLSALYAAGAGIAAQIYGYMRFKIVTGIIENEAHMIRHAYSADIAGVIVATTAALVTAAFVLYIILLDGFGTMQLAPVVNKLPT